MWEWPLAPSGDDGQVIRDVLAGIGQKDINVEIRIVDQQGLGIAERIEAILGVVLIQPAVVDTAERRAVDPVSPLLGTVGAAVPLIPGQDYLVV